MSRGRTFYNSLIKKKKAGKQISLQITAEHLKDNVPTITRCLTLDHQPQPKNVPSKSVNRSLFTPDQHDATTRMTHEMAHPIRKKEVQNF